MQIRLKLHRCFGQNISEDMHVIWIYTVHMYVILIYFCRFFDKLNLVIFQSLLLAKCIDSGYLVRATPPTTVFYLLFSRAL